ATRAEEGAARRSARRPSAPPASARSTTRQSNVSAVSRFGISAVDAARTTDRAAGAPRGPAAAPRGPRTGPGGRAGAPAQRGSPFAQDAAEIRNHLAFGGAL